ALLADLITGVELQSEHHGNGDDHASADSDYSLSAAAAAELGMTAEQRWPQDPPEAAPPTSALLRPMAMQRVQMRTRPAPEDLPAAVDRYAVLSDAGVLLVTGGKLTAAAMWLPGPYRGAALRRYWQRVALDRGAAAGAEAAGRDGRAAE
ncbi:unnamed protein product, partial [Prorocentrum cordatum]